MAVANQRSEEQSREVPLQKLGKLDDPTNAQQITTTATSFLLVSLSWVPICPSFTEQVRGKYC